MSLSHGETRRRLAECGQAHLLDFWDQLDREHREQLSEQLDSIDFRQVGELFAKAMNSLNEDALKLDARMKPVPEELYESEEQMDPKALEEYRATGLEEISEGRVAVLLMAGGQGTRLGVSHPKGMYSVGLPSGKTLFQIQAERIRRVVALAKRQTGRTGKICWYIMTSGPTNDVTLEYLRKNNFFGLNENDVVLFQQGLLPCFDFNGKIFLEDKHRVALAPDGNGGIYRALRENKILQDMRERGVRHVHVHSVDNILTKVADPIFVGYCVKKGADCGAKVVSKAAPNEAVGVVCRVDDRFQVVEYSEITEATANLRHPDGRLVFSAGNICNHYFSVDFLERVSSDLEHRLKLHVARKKIPHVDELGVARSPGSPNGIKIEKFVFDVFEFADKFVVFEVPRDSEFSALKNSDAVGKDCPRTSRRDLLRLHGRYVSAAGGEVDGDEVEVSPLLSYAGEDLEERVKGKRFGKKCVLLSDEELLGNNNNDVVAANGNGV